ncbi:regulatory protein RecX [Bifidobacterium sp. ESL0704]|nr:regulatory protein RecX [Bifidobacterium sp. ESL0704]WEV53533.1 regulatory protein RecX [Bifidobacterium sp. ESL0704]
MISAEEFLQGRHLSDVPSDDGGHDSTAIGRIAEMRANGRNSGASGNVDSVDTVVAGSSVSDSRSGRTGSNAFSARNRKPASSKRPNRAHTHAVAVTSNYTSGFGGSLDDGDTFNAPRRRRKFGKYARGRGNTRYRKYRSGAPMKRVPDDPADPDACREAALTLLDAAARSSGALIKRLANKGYDPQVAEDVVMRLVDVHLIDDEEYARAVVRSCATRMLGFRGTAMELRRKGVDDGLARRVEAEAREQGVFEDAAWQLGRKVAAKTEGLELQVRRRRFWGAGGRKGHDPETLRRVAHELFDHDAEG